MTMIDPSLTSFLEFPNSNETTTMSHSWILHPSLCSEQVQLLGNLNSQQVFLADHMLPNQLPLKSILKTIACTSLVVTRLGSDTALKIVEISPLLLLVLLVNLALPSKISTFTQMQ